MLSGAVFVLRFLVLSLVGVSLLAGCAKPPQSSAALTATMPIDTVVTQSFADPRSVPAATSQPLPQLVTAGSLAGRTLTISNSSQLVLRPREVVLTFDDGPRPGRTEAILDALDARGVKATFLMLGYAAQQHPALVRKVALRGHTIGSHTFGHADLAHLSQTEAVAEMRAGYEAVAAALEGARREPSRFFRFPYLSQNGLLRTSVIDSNLIVLGVDVDSKDYYQSSPREVMYRTLERLDRQGQGVILFHDIHQRTVTMLPEFLDELHARGYSVVSLKSTDGSVFDTPVITADIPAASAPL